MKIKNREIKSGDTAGKYQLMGYDQGSFLIQQPDGTKQWQSGAIFITADVIMNLTCQNFSELQNNLIIPLLPPGLELLLIGTGKEMLLPEAQQRQNLKLVLNHVEWMTTAAAVRSYQITLNEGRKTAALLLPL